MIKDIELAWLAGIWDGEGTILMFEHPDSTTKSKKIKPVCSVVNTDINIINEVQRLLLLLNCNFLIYEHKPINKKHKLQWRVQTSNMNYIKTFIENIKSYLKSDKRSNADIVLRYVTQRLDKLHNTPRSFNGTVKYDDKDWSFLEDFRSSQTTREAPKGDDIVGSGMKVPE